MIRVLIAEDQVMVRGALATLLGLEDDIQVVAQVGAGDLVLSAAEATDPDVALLDIEMPGLDGLAAAEALHGARPACVIIILTTFGRPGYLRRAMEAGASGFLVKDGPAEELAAAIRRAVAGERPRAPPMPSSPRGCSSPKARCAIICRPPSRRRVPSIASRPPTRPGERAGSEPIMRQHGPGPQTAMTTLPRARPSCT